MDVKDLDAENDCSLNCGGRVLLSIDGCHGGFVPPILAGELGLYPEEAHTDRRGQLRVHLVEKQRHRWTRAGQAH